ncbi:MAG: YggS family pyridoxal phosphate-dependent enzyme [Candidatus Marinimicrobia bacterium CG_4_9_14_3_um_filter_48_9]|nr:MAG: YggS family pyridoxal phosphate-dependent enzyme [Candidatus Marinimicrobia bacterium CG_4_9_14_3_um_filter_48_9]
MTDTRPPKNSISENLKRVCERMSRAADTAHRLPSEITLIGVTKFKSVPVIEMALDAGLTNIGENRLQEAREKFPLLDLTHVKRHFIGHLQTNKVKWVPALFDVVQSIDSEKVATALSHECLEQIAGTIQVFIQVNTSGEPSKFGVEPATAGDLVGYCLEQKGLEIQGLMTIGPNTNELPRIQKSFMLLRNLAEQIQSSYRADIPRLDLSMGMTDDFEWAIAEGATHVRIGRAIFGERD